MCRIGSFTIGSVIFLGSTTCEAEHLIQEPKQSVHQKYKKRNILSFPSSGIWPHIVLVLFVQVLDMSLGFLPLPLYNESERILVCVTGSTENLHLTNISQNVHNLKDL